MNSTTSAEERDIHPVTTEGVTTAPLPPPRRRKVHHQDALFTPEEQTRLCVALRNAQALCTRTALADALNVREMTISVAVRQNRMSAALAVSLARLLRVPLECLIAPPHAVEVCPGRCIMSPQAVVALIVNPAGQVLVIRSRKLGRQWELPGGGIQEGESPVLATRREVFEETGIRINNGLRSLGILAGIPREGVTEPLAVELFFGCGEGAPKAGSDADLAQWWDALTVLTSGELSHVASRVALLAWAEGARGASSDYT